MMLRRSMSNASRGRGYAFIISFSAVGNRNVLRTWYFSISRSARSAIEAPAIADDRLAEVQRGQQRVHEAAGPRPVGRRPEEIARLRKAVVRMDEAGQVAEQAAMRHQRALRRAGRAARVDEQRGIVGRRRRPASNRGDARCDQRLVRRRRATRARRRRRSTCASVGQRSRGSARGWAATADRRTRPAPRCSPAGTRAHRDRTGTTAARRSRPAGRRRGARRPSRGAAAGSARPCRRARRRAPPARSTSRLASRSRSQYVSADVAPDSSSQYSAKRAAVARPARAAGVRDVELARDVPAPWPAHSSA